MVEAGSVAETDGVRRREQPEAGVRPDHAVLVEQGQLALDLEHPLDHEHDVRAAGIVLVEAQRHRVLQRPWQQALAELGDLFVVAQHDRILADEIDTADVAVEIDADARPVEPRGDLLDMGGFAGAVIPTDHHPPVEREASEDRERRVMVEAVGIVEIGDVLARLAERRHLEVAIDPEGLAHRDRDVGLVERKGTIGGRWLNGWHSCLASQWWRKGVSGAARSSIRNSWPSAWHRPG